MSHSGILYLVATPIGNLGDITLRALEILKQVDYIAAEDTRYTRRLLANFSITRPLISLYEYNEQQRSLQLLKYLQAGKNIALVSDAGTPLISDPGFILVRTIRAEGGKVVPVPGACALIAGLTASGLPTDRFVFEGFLPAKSPSRQQRLRMLLHEQRTLIFYEAVHRILPSLTDMLEIFGAERQAVITRELTKRYETIRDGSLSELLTWLCVDSEQLHGEFVIFVHGAAEPIPEDKGDINRTLSLLMQELPLKQAVNLVVQIYGAKRNEVYQLALGLSKS